MSNKEYLSEKHCPCCYLRLNKLKKSEIRAVSSEALLEKLNAARNNILVKANKLIDENVVRSGDLVCKRCITFAIRFKIPSSSKQPKHRQLSVHRFFRDTYSTASTSRDADFQHHSSSRESDSSEQSMYEAELEESNKTK
jgi:hypothetical protein